MAGSIFEMLTFWISTNPYTWSQEGVYLAKNPQRALGVSATAHYLAHSKVLNKCNHKKEVQWRIENRQLDPQFFQVIKMGWSKGQLLKLN